MNRYVQERDSAEIAAGGYKVLLGGGAAQWDARGAAQLAFLQAMGLTRATRFLDIGCGPARAGVPIIGWLDPGRYTGFDFNRSFLTAADQAVAAAGLQDRAPRFLHVQGFDVAGRIADQDMGLAFSVLNHCDAADRAAFFAHIARAFRPGALLLISHAGWFDAGQLAGSGLALDRMLQRPDCPWFEADWTQTELQAGVFPVLALRVLPPDPHP
jgi:SAM-dependent methyltransferase